VSGKFTRKDSKTRQSVLKQFESTRFASIIKDKDFYEKHAARRNAAKTARRSYFYNVDLQGQLFLEETMPKNIATSIKDAKFLDFFFRRLQPIDETFHAYMREHDISAAEYPFVSPCAGEFSFVRPAASPIVFHTLTKGPARDASSFIYAGSLTEPFDPAGSLAISQNSGLMYHGIQSSSYLFASTCPKTQFLQKTRSAFQTWRSVHPTIECFRYRGCLCTPNWAHGPCRR
jgi:Domain of unknown function (DUF4505)